MSQFKEVKVRVHLNDTIMNDPRYQAILSQGERGTLEEYFLNNLRFDCMDGRFYIDAPSGQVPTIFRPYIMGRFSIRRNWLPGLRKEGLHLYADYPLAEARIRQCVTYKGDAPIFNIDIDGTDLNDVLGLYKAIVDDNVIPPPPNQALLDQIADLKRRLEAISSAGFWDRLIWVIFKR